MPTERIFGVCKLAVVILPAVGCNEYKVAPVIPSLFGNVESHNPPVRGDDRTVEDLSGEGDHRCWLAIR